MRRTAPETGDEFSTHDSSYILPVCLQIDTAVRRGNRSHKRTRALEPKTSQTLRFEALDRAGRVARPDAVIVLRTSGDGLAKNVLLRMGERPRRAA